MATTEAESIPAGAASMPEARATSRYLSHIGCSVGAAQPVAALAQKEKLSSDVLATFQQRGLRDYREDSRGIPEMCVASALETLAEAGLEPADVDSILIASSNSDGLVSDDDETALFTALHGAGFERARVLGLTLQACSAGGDALRVAGGLVGPGSGSPILVIVFGQKKKMSRLGPQANLVFSDGAASCLVSSGKGTFEICASEGVTNMRLGEMGRAGSIAQFQGGLIELREITRKVCEDAEVELDEIRAFFGTNAGVGHLQLMAQAAEVPLDRIYEDDVASYSHVHSCDNLISLRHFSEKNTLAPGDPFLLLAWSPHVVSASILRYRGE